MSASVEHMLIALPLVFGICEFAEIKSFISQKIHPPVKTKPISSSPKMNFNASEESLIRLNRPLTLVDDGEEKIVAKEEKVPPKEVRPAKQATAEEILVLYPSFSECMVKFMNNAGWKVKEFEQITTLERSHYYRLKKTGRKPEVRTIVTVCLALRLDLSTTEVLLKRADRSFQLDIKAHAEYRNLFIHHSGKSIPEYNEILKSRGIGYKDLLGNEK